MTGSRAPVVTGPVIRAEQRIGTLSTAMARAHSTAIDLIGSGIGWAYALARIVLTNRNHFRASMRVKERTGAPIAIHPADAAFAREKGTQVDAELRAGERLGPIEVVAAPGKSPGEVALHWPDRRILLVGDACVGKPPGECALLPDAVIDDKARLATSLRTLAALDFDALLLGDGAPILEGGRAALPSTSACGSRRTAVPAAAT